MLDFGFFESFKEDDCLVFHGDPPAMRMFASVLDQVASASETTLRLNDLPGFVAHAIELTLVCSEGNGQPPITRRGEHFRWQCNSETLRSYVRLTETLAEAAHGHAYLDQPGQRYLVMASCSEYGGLFRGLTDA